MILGAAVKPDSEDEDEEDPVYMLERCQSEERGQLEDISDEYMAAKAKQVREVMQFVEAMDLQRFNN